MPQYDYVCPNCKQDRIASRSLGDPRPVRCLKCFNVVKKVPSIPASIRVGKYGKGGGT